MSTDGPERGESLKPRRRLWLWFAAISAVFAFLFYQSVNYIGLMYRFAEWQFEVFDRYFPVLSIIVILVILYLVWEAVRAILRRGRRKTASEPLHLRRIAARHSAALFLRCVAVLAIILFAGTFIQWLQQPSSRGPATRIALASGQPAALTPGPVSVSGLRAIGPIARYSEDFLFLRRTRFLAPVGRSSAPGTPYNLFVEVRGMDPVRDVPPTTRGVLRFDAMMPEIRTLYRDADFPVAEQSAVIFANPGSANRPHFVLLAELAAFAILAWIFARHFTRTAKELEADARSATTPALS